jgi:hypothetical protein
MTVAELIKALQELPQDIPVMVYESDPDDYLPVTSLEHLSTATDPHVRLYSGLEQV